MVSRVSVNVRVRFRFIGANLYIAMTPLNFTRPWESMTTNLLSATE